MLDCRLLGIQWKGLVVMIIRNRLTVGKRKFKQLQDTCLATNPDRVLHHHGDNEYGK